MSELARRIARLRVPAGFILGPLALYLARPTPTTLALGASIALLGEALRIWAAGHLEKGREVTMTGPYAFLRHPLYVGSALLGVGFSVAAAAPAVAIIVLGYLAVTLTAAIRTEERHLTEKFGTAYPAYRRGRASGAPRQFSLVRVRRNREHRAVLGVLAALALLAWKAL